MRQVDEYLGTIPVSDHNPAVLFAWDDAAVDEFIKAANSLAADAEDELPLWFSQPPGNVSPASLANDMVSYLAQLGGGRCDRVLLAPNSLIQYGHLQERLQYMQYDPALQRCMAHVTPGRALARTFVLTGRDTAFAVRTRLLPPASPARPLFD